MYINTLSFNAGIRTALPDFSLDSGLRGDLTKVCFAALHQPRLSVKASVFRRSSSLPLITFKNVITMILLFFCKVKDFFAIFIIYFQNSRLSIRIRFPCKPLFCLLSPQDQVYRAQMRFAKARREYTRRIFRTKEALFPKQEDRYP